MDHSIIAHGDAARGTSRGRVAFAVAEVRWASIAVAAFVVALALRRIGVPQVVSGAMFVGCYLAGGWEPAAAGVRALRGRVLDVDLLMVVAAIGAAAIGQVVDGGLLIVIFAVSASLEALATKRTEDSVRSLLMHAPEQASLLTDGAERLVDTATLRPGDVILVRPGERIGADGTVQSGGSDVDQATITGEPLPVFRTTGDEVFAGTLVRGGSLEISVSRPASESVVARIATLVERASETKARTHLFIERVEQRYSMTVVFATVAVFLVPLVAGASVAAALLRAMTFMIVASPCAVVLSTMPPLLSAIANAGRHGVLVKSAVVMEQLATITQVAFDKTGTVTSGRPHVVEVVSIGLDHQRALSLTAAAEHASEHPLGKAIVAEANRHGIPVPPARGFSAHPGSGVVAIVDGHRVQAGGPALLAENPDATASAAVGRIERLGRTAVVVVVDSCVGAVIGLADEIRPGAASTVAAIHDLTGTTPVLITGDNEDAARRMARSVGIDDVFASMLPHDKLTAVEQLRGNGARVLFVGDGVNDAPALAAADVGVAMGGIGSDLVLQTADIVIVGDELATIPAVIELARHARRVVSQNLLLASAAIITLATWDLAGHLPLPLGVLGHEGGTVIVGLNGLRLLRRRAWTGTQPAAVATPKQSRSASALLNRRRRCST